MAYRAPAPEPEPDWHCKACGAPCMECDHAGSWPATPMLPVPSSSRSFWSVLVLSFLELPF